MNNKDVLEKLESIGACSDAVEWVKNRGGTSQELWNDCDRGDWMWWLLRNTKIPKKSISVSFAEYCAKNAKEYVDNVHAHTCAAFDAAYAAAYAAYADTTADIAAAFAAYAAAYAAYVAAYADIAAERKNQANWIREHIKCPL